MVVIWTIIINYSYNGPSLTHNETSTESLVIDGLESEDSILNHLRNILRESEMVFNQFPETWFFAKQKRAKKVFIDFEAKQTFQGLGLSWSMLCTLGQNELK